MIFDAPRMFVHTMPRQHAWRQTSWRCNNQFTSPSPCSFPCFGVLPAVFFFLVFFPFVLPLIKIAMCLFAWVVIPAAMSSILFSGIVDDDFSSSRGCCFMKKMSPAEQTKNSKKETVREALAKEKVTTTTDWSYAAARVETSTHDDNDQDDEADIKIVMAAAGVRPSDLKVSIVDREISVKGESTRGDAAFVIERTVAVPRHADAETCQVSSADGMITITMKRKRRKLVPVHVDVSTAGDEPRSTSDESETKGSSSASAVAADEWVPLGKEE